MSKLDGFEFVCCSIRPKIVPSESIISSSEGEISTDEESLGGRLPNRYYYANEGIEAREPDNSYRPYEPNAVINRQQLEAKQKTSFTINNRKKLSEELLADESKKNKAKPRESQPLSNSSGMDWLCSKLGTEIFQSDELFRDQKDKRRDRRQQRRQQQRNKFGDDDETFSDESCLDANCVEPKSGRIRRDKIRSSSSSNPEKYLPGEDRLICSSNCTPMYANRSVGDQGDRQRARSEQDKIRVTSANMLDHSLEDRASQVSHFTSKNSKRYELIQLGLQKHRREAERKRSTSRTQRNRPDTDSDDRTSSLKAPQLHHGMKYNRYN